eukprot:4643732-Ditylum_brightwellii.AAC.1
MNNDEGGNDFNKNNVVPKKKAILSQKQRSELASLTSLKSTAENTNASLGPRMASGSFGAIITALAVTPLEVVKVRQQAAISNTSNSVVVPNGA